MPDEHFYAGQLSVKSDVLTLFTYGLRFDNAVSTGIP